MKNPKKISSILLLITLLPISAKTILLNVDTGGDAPDATFDDFNDADYFVSESAAVTAVPNWASLGTAVLTDEDGLTYNVSTSGSIRSDYDARVESWNDLEPISEGYIHDRDTTSPNAITISGVNQFPLDEIITLTVYGIGDNFGQQSDFSATYGAATTPIQQTFYGDGPDRDVSLNSVPYVQFTFASDGVTTDLTINWTRYGSPTGSSGSALAAFNGFSVTSSTPSFGDVTAATLTATETVFLVGNPQVDLVAEGTFSVVGTIGVNTLGSSVTSFASSDSNVVSVSPTGQATLIQPGAADITVTVLGDNGTMATSAPLTLTVEAPTNFNFTPLADETNPNYLLAYGDNENIDVTADSASLTGVDIEGFTGFSYTISDNTVVELTDTITGAITPLEPGSVTLTAELEIPGGSPFSEAITINTEDANAITLTMDATPADKLFVGGGSANLVLTVTTPNITTPIDVTDIAGSEFFSDNGSDIILDATGLLTPGVSPLGDSTFEGSWLLADNSSISAFLTISLVEAAPKPITLLHRYEFSGTGGSAAPENTVIQDTVGSAHAEVLGVGAVFNADGSALVLPGGPNANDGAYVDFPDNLISTIPNIDTLGMTVEFWLSKGANTNWMRAFDFGDNGTPVNFVNLIAHRSGSGNISSEFTTDRTAFGGQFFTTTAGLVLDELSHLVMTIDPEAGTRNFYLNGASIGSSSLAGNNRSIAALNDVNNWLGRSNANTTDSRFDGTFDQFCIYTGIMTEAEAAAIYAANTGGSDLCLSIASVAGSNATVDISGLTATDTYHFQAFNSTTSLFEAVPGSEFVATASDESTMIDVSGFGSTGLFRLSEGAIPSP